MASVVVSCRDRHSGDSRSRAGGLLAACWWAGVGRRGMLGEMGCRKGLWEGFGVVACTAGLCRGLCGGTGAEVPRIRMRLPCAFVLAGTVSMCACHCVALARCGNCMHDNCHVRLAGRIHLDGTAMCGALVACACTKKGAAASPLSGGAVSVVLLSSLYRAGMLVFARCLLVAARGSASDCRVRLYQ